MLSHAWKTIFVHQRKCAGSSIIRAFGEHPLTPAGDFMNDGCLSAEYHDWKRCLLPEYYKFAVVRNPWDRFVSGWLYCEGTRDLPLRTVLRNLPAIEHDYVHVTRLQRETLYDLAGYLIVDKLVRFENLQGDFNEVCDTIGKPRVVLPRLLANRDRLPYQEYFRDPVDRDLFLRHFARDADTFGYTF